MNDVDSTHNTEHLESRKCDQGISNQNTNWHHREHCKPILIT